MAGKVLTRHRKNRAGVYTSWEYRFQSASVSGQRKWITQAGFQTKQEAYQAGMAAYQEYQNTGVHFRHRTAVFYAIIYLYFKIPDKKTPVYLCHNLMGHRHTGDHTEQKIHFSWYSKYHLF